MLSVENDRATSGALPPRIAATILSSLMPPTLLTFTPGFACSNRATTPLMIFSSRCVNPTHSVTVAGASGFSAALPEAAAEDVGAAPDEDEELEPLPPHAAASSAAAASSGASAAVRRVRKRIAFGMSAIVFPPPPRAGPR